ncbi:hypothetical protein QBC32DRAFT_221303, partial [Pseudoneurospora amorphoporcata]
LSTADPGPEGQCCPVSCCAEKLTQRRPAEASGASSPKPGTERILSPPRLRPLHWPRRTIHVDKYLSREGHESSHSTAMDCLELRGLPKHSRTMSEVSPCSCCATCPGRLPVGRIEGNELQSNSSETPVNSRNRGPEWAPRPGTDKALHSGNPAARQEPKLLCRYM